MKRIAIILLFVFAFFLPIIAYAHPGITTILPENIIIITDIPPINIQMAYAHTIMTTELAKTREAIHLPALQCKKQALLFLHLPL